MTRNNVATMRKFSIKLNILFAVFFIILLALGCWQLKRAEYKRNLQTRLITAAQQPGIKLQDLPSDKANHKQGFATKLSLEGYYDNSHNFLLANQLHNGQSGYRLVTPMRVADLSKLVLIDRGFIKASPGVQHPAIEQVTDLVNIEGIISELSHSLILKAEVEPTNSWPQRLQTIDYAAIATLLGKPVYEFILRSEDTLPSYQQQIARHYGYASQWFALALAALVYLYLQRRKEARS